MGIQVVIEARQVFVSFEFKGEHVRVKTEIKRKSKINTIMIYSN